MVNCLNGCFNRADLRWSLIVALEFFLWVQSFIQHQLFSAHLFPIGVMEADYFHQGYFSSTNLNSQMEGRSYRSFDFQIAARERGWKERACRLSATHMYFDPNGKVVLRGALDHRVNILSLTRRSLINFHGPWLTASWSAPPIISRIPVELGWPRSSNSAYPMVIYPFSSQALLERQLLYFFYRSTCQLYPPQTTDRRRCTQQLRIWKLSNVPADQRIDQQSISILSLSRVQSSSIQGPYKRFLSTQLKQIPIMERRGWNWIPV